MCYVLLKIKGAAIYNRIEKINCGADAKIYFLGRVSKR